MRTLRPSESDGAKPDRPTQPSASGCSTSPDESPPTVDVCPVGGGTIRRVNTLTDAQISTVAQTARCAVLPITANGTRRAAIAEMLLDQKVQGVGGARDTSLNKMK